MEPAIDVALIDPRQPYDGLALELRICEVGGLFLGRYRDKTVREAVIKRLKYDLPEQFHFSIPIDEVKAQFTKFFWFSFEHMGRRPNVFHILGLEELPEEKIEQALYYLQLGRELLSRKPYSLIFWVSPGFHKRLAQTSPDFYHWVFGVYDFDETDLRPEYLPQSVPPEVTASVLVDHFKTYLTNVIRQYKNWQEVKDGGEDFLIEVMGRADLFNLYVKSNCTDKDGRKIPLDKMMSEFLADPTKNFVTLLGDFGTGKSSFSLHYYIELAEQYLKGETDRIPVFISLKDYQRDLNIEDFIIKEIFDKLSVPVSLPAFQDIAQAGIFAFFVDGFDELAALADHEITVQNLKELTKLSFENILFMTTKTGPLPLANKVFLTSRTHYFLHGFNGRGQCRHQRLMFLVQINVHTPFGQGGTQRLDLRQFHPAQQNQALPLVVHDHISLILSQEIEQHPFILDLD
ncbi:MAG: hypothetical protein HQK58_12455 [Deltaproteobacteria bacterium]|nr:hypothetical protein [Deltaproteobacteria bacterium]